MAQELSIKTCGVMIILMRSHAVLWHIHNLYVYSVMWVKFVKRIVHLMLLIVYHFHENQCRAGHIFLMGMDKLHLSG